MSIEGNKTTVRRFITDVIVQGNMSFINQLCAPNYVNRLTGAGIESFKQASGLMRTAVPDWQFTIENLVAEGDEVVARFTVTGTVTGSVMGSKSIRKAHFCARADLLSSRQWQNCRRRPHFEPGLHAIDWRPGRRPGSDDGSKVIAAYS